MLNITFIFAGGQSAHLAPRLKKDDLDNDKTLANKDNTRNNNNQHNKYSPAHTPRPGTKNLSLTLITQSQHNAPLGLINNMTTSLCIKYYL